MEIEIGKVYKAKEDFPICTDNYGTKSGGGTVKAGQRFELTDMLDEKKKMFTLYALDIKFPFSLYMRKNDFNRLFEEE